MIEEFELGTDPAAIEDLRARVRNTRLPDGPEGWSLGVDVAYLRELLAYWADGFDWPAQEEALNTLPHHRSAGIHFVHVRSRAKDALPIVLTHGWPDSFWRYTKVIDRLAEEFHVVVPDVAGYGYSDRPVHPLSSREVAGQWAGLMSELGYERFGAAGGDIGSGVSRFLALDHPERVVAVHRTDAGLPVYTGDPADLAPEERDYLAAAQAWGAVEGGYAAMHRSKPQTAAAGLNDSPAGLAAWIVEKMRSWSDCGGDVERRFTKDEILTNVTIYWLTQTIGSSMRMYQANAAIPREQQARRVEVPSGFALFAGDILPAPRAWLDRMANTVHVSRPARGGHFAAFEEPELYADDLKTFFRAHG